MKLKLNKCLLVEIKLLDYTHIITICNGAHLIDVLILHLLYLGGLIMFIYWIKRW